MIRLARAPSELVFLLAGILATIEVRREGWLDRVVSHQKMKFLKDVKALVPIKAAIIPKPHGYVDSKDWTYDSVMHLIILLRASETAAPVHRAVRRAMRPTRRMIWSMKMGDTFSRFPSLSKSSMNEFYYDVASAEDYEDVIGEPTPADSGVIIVYNPVEAKLPSSQISIELLKEIMIQRAIAARKMPPVHVTTIPWEPMNGTNTNGTSAASGATGEGDAKKEGDGAKADAVNGTAAAGDPAVAEGGAPAAADGGATAAADGGATAAADGGATAAADGGATAAADGGATADDGSQTTVDE